MLSCFALLPTSGATYEIEAVFTHGLISWSEPEYTTLEASVVIKILNQGMGHFKTSLKKYRNLYRLTFLPSHAWALFAQMGCLLVNIYSFFI